MTASEQQVRDLQREARGLPYGSTKIALLEEAARLADQLGDVRLQYQVRNQLIDVASFSDRPDVLLVTFSWCRAQFDRTPDRFSEHNLLWQYKWVLSHAGAFPEISLGQIDELIEDFEKRCERGGYTMHAACQKRRDILVEIHDFPKAKSEHARFRKQRRDMLSDCAACVASNTVDYHLALGRTADGLKAASPLLNGKLTCAEEPRRTYAKALLPLLQKQQDAEAERCHKLGVRDLGRAEYATGEWSDHLQYLTLAGEHAKARQMMTRRLPGAMEDVSLARRADFYQSCWLLLNRLIANGSSALKLKLPDGLPDADAKGRTNLQELADWFAAESLRIGKLYDARNGNDHNEKALAKLPELLDHARPVVG